MDIKKRNPGMDDVLKSMYACSLPAPIEENEDGSTTVRCFGCRKREIIVPSETPEDHKYDVITAAGFHFRNVITEDREKYCHIYCEFCTQLGDSMFQMKKEEFEEWLKNREND